MIKHVNRQSDYTDGTSQTPDDCTVSFKKFTESLVFSKYSQKVYVFTEWMPHFSSLLRKRPAQRSVEQTKVSK